MTNPNLIKLAQRLGNEELPKQKSVESKQIQVSTSLEGVNLGNYIFMPQHNLYVAKKRRHFNKNWYDSHKALYSEKARMLTLREFIDFLALLKNGNAEFKNLYNEITEVRSPYRAEWIDADFKVANDKLYINYNHKIFGGEVKPQNSDLIEKCLMEDCKVDIGSFNRQGLPTKKGNDFSYWYPRSDNNSVAGFGAFSGGAGLCCCWDPRGSGAELGVRPCVAPQKN